MDIFKIIAIAIPSIMIIGWIIAMLVGYIIPNKSIVNGFREWYHESDNDI